VYYVCSCSPVFSSQEQRLFQLLIMDKHSLHSMRISHTHKMAVVMVEETAVVMVAQAAMVAVQLVMATATQVEAMVVAVLAVVTLAEVVIQARGPVRVIQAATPPIRRLRLLCVLPAQRARTLTV
jgi:hypothetical protein